MGIAQRLCVVHHQRRCRYRQHLAILLCREENDGAAFLLIYLACVVLVGLTLLIAELSLGHRAQGNAVSAFENADGRGYWRYFGWICLFGLR